MNLTRREFTTDLLVALAGASALGGCAPAISTQSRPSKTIDELVDDVPSYEPYVHNGKLKEGYALLIAYNVKSPDFKHITYKQAESNGKIIPHTNQGFISPLLEPDTIPYVLKDLPKFLYLVGFTSPEDLILPRDINDPKRNKEILAQFIPLQPSETFDQHIKDLTEHSRYFQLYEKASKGGNVLAESILHREQRIMLELALNGTKHNIDAKQMNYWYGLNRLSDFIPTDFGAVIFQVSQLGRIVHRDLSNGYAQIDSEVYLPSRDARSYTRRNPKIETPLEYFFEMIRGTKYDVGDYNKSGEQLQSDFNSGKLDAHHVTFRNRLHLHLINDSLSPHGTTVEEREANWSKRAAASTLTSDAFPRDVKITIHESNKI